MAYLQPKMAKHVSQEALQKSLGGQKKMLRVASRVLHKSPLNIQKKKFR